MTTSALSLLTAARRSIRYQRLHFVNGHCVSDVIRPSDAKCVNSNHDPPFLVHQRAAAGAGFMAASVWMYWTPPECRTAGTIPLVTVSESPRWYTPGKPSANTFSAGLTDAAFPSGIAGNSLSYPTGNRARSLASSIASTERRSGSSVLPPFHISVIAHYVGISNRYVPLCYHKTRSVPFAGKHMEERRSQPGY